MKTGEETQYDTANIGGYGEISAGNSENDLRY
jgi:hypothetical protein